MLPAVHPLKAGALCLGRRSRSAWRPARWASGPGDTPRDGFLDPDYLRDHGGLVGESLFWVLSHALLRGRLAHPVRLPAAGRRAAPHRRVDRRRGAGHARRATTTGERVRTATAINLPTERLGAAAGRPARARAGGARRAARARGPGAGGARHPRGGAGARRRRALPGSLRGRRTPRAGARGRARGARATSRGEEPAPDARAGAHADGQPALAGDRVRRLDYRMPGRRSSSARTAPRRSTRRASSASAASSSRRSATSTSRRA